MILTDADRARIIEAIRIAETRTTGEIYCAFTRASSAYPVFPVAWSAALALLVPLPLIYLTAWPALVIYSLQLLAFLGAYYLLSHDNVRYRIVPRQTKEARAHQEALRQFAAHGLQHTELRTGVLIFVSIAERYAEILADAGIARKVPSTVWDDAVSSLTSEIAAGRAADGFVATIEKCTAELAKHFPPGAINRNELPNAIVELSP
jgi:putative membrane protein